MKFAVVIPTYIHDIPFVSRLLESINKQTRLPEFVVVHASSCRPENVAELRAGPWKFSFRIETTEEVQTAAQNRNRGADLVPGEIDILSFFDSDDVMHPRRIEIVERAFQDPTVDVVTHSATYGPLMLKEIDWKPLIEPICLEKVNPDLKYEHIYNNYTGGTMSLYRVEFPEGVAQQMCAHCTVRRHCFQTVRYQTNAAISYRCEDTLFLAELCRAGFTFLPISQSLMHYSEISLENTDRKLSHELVLLSRN